MTMTWEPADTAPLHVDPDPPGDLLHFPANYKPPPDGRHMLVPIDRKACRHWNTSYEIDVDGGKCRCLACKQEVTPFFVLKQLMDKESQWQHTRAAYQEEMKRLEERSSTKCRACGAMTRISRH